jgi:hypothetical protein
MQVFVVSIMLKPDSRSEAPDLTYQGVFTSIVDAAESLVLHIYNDLEYFCKDEDIKSESTDSSTNGNVTTITTTKTITRTNVLTEEIVDEVIDTMKNSETEGEVRDVLSDFIVNYCNSECWVYEEDWDYKLIKHTVDA